jgi:tetratricopeptide (TPR) repeat protein
MGRYDAEPAGEASFGPFESWLDGIAVLPSAARLIKFGAMPHLSRRHPLRFAALVLGLLCAPPPAAWSQQPAKPAASQPAKPPATNPGQDAEYAACLDMARTKPDAAIERARKWWEGGGNFGPRHCLAVALVAKESYVQAAKLLEDLADDAKEEILPLKADLYNQAGQAYWLAGLNDQALGLHDKAVRLKPRDADFLIDRAVSRDEAGKHFDAIDDLNLAIQIAPDRPEAWLYRANAHRHVNSLDLALEDANRAVALSSRSPEALLERATIKALRKDDAGARADLQSILKLAPDTIQGKEAAKRLKASAPPAKKKVAPPPQPSRPN